MPDRQSENLALALPELRKYLDAVLKAYVDPKLRPGEALGKRILRSGFLVGATWNLRALQRRAMRAANRTGSSANLSKLFESVFTERRVLRSSVPLLPNYPAVAAAVTGMGREIAATETGPERQSVASALRLCGSSAEALISTYDDPAVGARLTGQLRATLGLDALEARKLLPKQPTSDVLPQPKRIAYVAAMTLPQKPCGYSSRTEGVALAYQTLGFTVDVISKPGFPLNMTANKAKETVPPVQEHNGVTYHRLLEPLVNSRRYFEYARKAADVLEEKIKTLQPEHVIAASNYENALPALIAARRLGLPFTYEVRGMWELTRASDSPGFEDSRQFSMMQHMEAFVCKHADSVLTLTQGMTNSLVERGVDCSKIALMPNGVSADMFEVCARDDALLDSLGLTPDTVIIGYAGAFKEYEGLPDLAQSCAKLVDEGLDIALLILGDEKPDAFGSTRITAEIRDAFADVTRKERLLMTGRVPFTEMPRYYSIMDICPITRRGYMVSELVSPIKPVEALAQGKAVVLSDVEALKFFSQGETTALMFRKNDPEDLAAKLRELVQSKSLREELGEKGRDFVATELRWQTICEKAARHIGLLQS